MPSLVEEDIENAQPRPQEECLKRNVFQEIHLNKFVWEPDVLKIFFVKRWYS